MLWFKTAKKQKQKKEQNKTHLKNGDVYGLQNKRNIKIEKKMFKPKI